MAPSTTTVPAQYGRAYREFVETALDLTEEQVALVQFPGAPDAAEAYDQAVQRVDEATLELVAAAEPTLDGYTPCVINAAVAVLARDRGLITTADFDTITGPWVAAGLPLPEVVTGDDEAATFTPLDTMTSDRLADGLLQAAFSNDAQEHRYGAVLLLTGYNHGELLAYDVVREYLDLRPGGQLIFDWNSLRIGLDSGDLAATGDLTEEALYMLDLAVNLSLPDKDNPHRQLITTTAAANAEAVVFAFGYTVGGAHALNPFDPDTTPDLAIPSQRQVRWEPTS